jgi:toxin ParE1/3/4
MRLRRPAIAEQDLLNIWEYIAQDNPDAADRMLQRFEQRFKVLLKFPYTGESQERYRLNLRSVIEGRHIIFYEPTPDGILIHRVLQPRDAGKSCCARTTHKAAPRPVRPTLAPSSVHQRFHFRLQACRRTSPRRLRVSPSP